MTLSVESTGPADAHPGLRYARWGGHALGLFLLLAAGIALGSESPGSFAVFKAAYFIVYGSLVTLRFERMAESLWKPAFVALCVLSAGFVFVMIAEVMFNYMEAADRGERLGVPGLEGSLVFLALLQVPVVLFQRKPDLLD